VRNVSLEQLIVLAVFLLVPLVNLLARWLRQRGEAPPRPPAEIPHQPEPVPFRLPPTVRLAEPVTPQREEQVTRPRPAPPPALLRRQPRLRISDPEDVRYAVMLMAVLGPCRGLEPPGPEGERLDR
jgi:hypothetical protein